MKVPSTAWLPRSRMKLRSRRGPNCDEASVSATMVMENTTPATVIIEPAIVDSSERAPSGPPAYPQSSVRCTSLATTRSRLNSAKAKTKAPTTITAGKNQKLVRSTSRATNSRVFMEENKGNAPGECCACRRSISAILAFLAAANPDYVPLGPRQIAAHCLTAHGTRPGKSAFGPRSRWTDAAGHFRIEKSRTPPCSLVR